MGYAEDKEWFWWNSYQGKTMNIPLRERLRSFNPIYRISEKALNFLDEFLKAQNCGHHEVLIPSSLFHSGLQLQTLEEPGDLCCRDMKTDFIYQQICSVKISRRNYAMFPSVP